MSERKKIMMMIPKVHSQSSQVSFSQQLVVSAVSTTEITTIIIIINHLLQVPRVSTLSSSLFTCFLSSCNNNHRRVRDSFIIITRKRVSESRFNWLRFKTQSKGEGRERTEVRRNKMIIKIKYRILIDVIYSSTFYFSLFSHTHSLRSERKNGRGREERKNERGSKKERKFTVFFLPTDIHHHHHHSRHHHPSDECRRKKRSTERVKGNSGKKKVLTINL